ncbi:disulfide isomerase [Salmonella enterica subsp. arizonae]|nr:disulfide isomerase [Salmonella enterica subsp. arizonae]
MNMAQACLLASGLYLILLVISNTWVIKLSRGKTRA